MRKWLDARLPTGCLPWQQRFVAGVEAHDESALSVAKGAGKSTMVGAMVAGAVHPDGPWHRADLEVVVVASALEQGKIVFNAAKRALGDLDDAEWRVLESNAAVRIEHRASRSFLRVLGSDPRRAQGLGSNPGGLLIAADEPASWEPTKAERMFATLVTALGKQPNSKFVAIGTRPEVAA